MATYWWATEVESVAKALLLEQRHEQLDRPDVDFWFLFQDPPAKSRRMSSCIVRRKPGPDVRGLPSSRREMLGDRPLDFFLITIAHEVWAVLTPEAREALVDHELSHCEVTEPDDEDEDRKLSLLPHDVEAFWDNDEGREAHAELEARGF